MTASALAFDRWWARANGGDLGYMARGMSRRCRRCHSPLCCTAPTSRRSSFCTLLHYSYLLNKRGMARRCR